MARTIALVLLACLPIYWFGLNLRGLSDSEGHRVGPAWELLTIGWNGSLLVPHLFEQSYIRKPPGMPWAIAATSAVLGQNEWGARAASALAMTLLAIGAALVARRWFGSAAALPAGLAAALWPMMVAPGRTAEIEALNNLAAAVSVWLVIDLLLRPHARARLWSIAVLAGLAITATGLIKGPAGLPVIAAALAVALWHAAPARRPWMLVVLAVPAILWIIAFRLASAHVDAQRLATGMEPVRQGVSEFLWGGQPITLERALAVASMPIVAVLSALPVGVLIALPLVPRLAPKDQPARAIAATLALAAVLSLVGMAIFGVHNPRYAQPSLAPLAPLAGAAWIALRAVGGTSATPVGRVATVVLLLACVGLGPLRDALRSPTNSGKAAGIALADAFPADAPSWITLRAGDAVEARPEVLLWLRKEAQRHGRTVRVIWTPAIEPPPPGDYALLRADRHSAEPGLARDRGWDETLETLGTARAHIFEFRLVRQRPRPAPAPAAGDLDAARGLEASPVR